MRSKYNILISGKTKWLLLTLRGFKNQCHNYNLVLPKRWRDLTADWQGRARRPTLGLLRYAYDQHQSELRRLVLPSWLQRGPSVSVGERRAVSICVSHASPTRICADICAPNRLAVPRTSRRLAGQLPRWSTTSTGSRSMRRRRYGGGSSAGDRQHIIKTATAMITSERAALKIR
jgi:hypothetical protein